LANVDGSMPEWAQVSALHIRPHFTTLCLESEQTKNLKATYRRVQMLRISQKYCKRVAPDVQISGQNSKF